MRIWLFIVLAASAFSLHAEDQDSRALKLADDAEMAASKASGPRLFSETGISRASFRYGTEKNPGLRTTLDLQVDGRISTTVRGTFSNRLDMHEPRTRTGERFVNTLREAYLNWQPEPDTIIDAGRVNLRYGVGFGYNPTDYFRRNAIRSFVSSDPDSLRSNRLGTFLLRGQKLWKDGSLALHYSPKLANSPSTDPFSLDTGATNDADRALVAFSQRISEDLQPQWVLFKEGGRSPQFGLNLTTLVGNSAVGYLEWSGGRSASLQADASGQSGHQAFRNRVTTGMTYTTPFKLSLTGEYIYNGASLAEDEWNSLRLRSPLGLNRYLSYIQSGLETPSRHNLFFHALWKDTLVSNLDLAGFARVSQSDRSRQYWAEARYRWEASEMFLQYQLNHGDPGSAYGSISKRQIWSLFFRYFF